MEREQGLQARELNSTCRVLKAVGLSVSVPLLVVRGALQNLRMSMKKDQV